MSSVYKYVRKIGEGYFASVYEVQDCEIGTNFALKLARGSKRSVLRREADLHATLSHPNLVKFEENFQIDIFTADVIHSLPAGKYGKCDVIIMELCDSDNLERRLKSQVGGKFDLETIKFYAKQIGQALKYLKSQGVVHRDLKPPNILFKGDVVKLADFGLATKSIGYGEKGIGTPLYMAPEALKGSASFASDVFSFGVVLYFMSCGKLPYPASNLDELLRLVSEADLEFPSDSTADENLKDLIERMMLPEAYFRPTIEEVLLSDFFTKTAKTDLTDIEDLFVELEI